MFYNNCLEFDGPYLTRFGSDAIHTQGISKRQRDTSERLRSIEGKRQQWGKTPRHRGEKKSQARADMHSQNGNNPDTRSNS